MSIQTNSVEPQVKQQVRQFYDQIGWQEASEGFFQNARYEDLRPVSREYIHRCHLRITRHINATGRYLLDAGSGPIQYPEYLEYSIGYQYRVCADISIVALQEARKRIGEHGLVVVSDVANLPFKQETFGGAVSLHTIHHLPEDEHLQAYDELYRVLEPHSAAAVVNGWPSSRLMSFFNPLIRWSNRLRGAANRLLGTMKAQHKPERTGSERVPRTQSTNKPKGTFTSRHDVAWIRNRVGTRMPVTILVWRSVSVRFQRALIHPRLGGRWWLRLLFWLEERFPHYLGENGQYPLIVISKK